MSKFSVFKPVIGLEIHVELKTKSKMFCQCPADYFGKPANSQVCPVCLGLPGALPVPNKKAIEWTILLGKALNCKINRFSRFDRKHYFYPDLPKGYQISQYDEPIAVEGRLSIIDYQFSQKKEFRIRRVHLEEDTGKLIHKEKETLVDFNRSGVPLVEIVTEPDFDNADEVKRFLEELQVIIRYLGISDADMEKGSMRLEPNISIMKYERHNTKHKKLPNYKVEIKNINSFRFVKQAIEYEIERQINILKKGEMPIQETRGFDEKKEATYSQRTKEEADDYRYFPEPDIPPMVFSQEYIRKIEEQLPELPQQKVDRYVRKLGLRYQDAFILTRNRRVAGYFESVNEKLKIKSEKLQLKIKNLEQTVANFIINRKISTDLSEVDFIEKIIQVLKPKEIDEKTLNTSINRIIEVNKKAVEDYRKGKKNALMFLVGQVMKEMKGKVEAKKIIKILKEKLKGS